MREALLIFRKDAYHQRVLLAAFLALATVHMAIDIVLPRHPEMMTMQAILGMVLLMAMIGLVYRTAQQERIMGERQYWLTRPFPWRSILAAKFLFTFVCVALPVSLSTLVALALNGAPLADTFSWPLFVLVGGAWVITLASITRTTVQFVLSAVAYLFLSFFAILMTSHLLGYDANDWGGAQSVRTGADTLFTVAVLTVVLVRQYQGRTTLSSRVVFAAGILVAMIGLPGWHAAFALREKVEGPGASGGVRMTFDFARSQPIARGWTYNPGEDVVAVKFPIAITGISSYAMLVGERVRTTIDAPGGRHWDSGWRFLGGVMGERSPGAGPHRIYGEESSYWVAANVDRSFFEETKDMPVRIQSTAAFSMLSAPLTAHLPIPCRGYRLAPGHFPYRSRGAVRGSRTSLDHVPVFGLDFHQQHPSFSGLNTAFCGSGDAARCGHV
ncbi:membrane hypothetical protein [Candidatus Sulfopaludibacter sp. SbA3]|nr:membrane hypothetical protein [Candidatus Sulfopaludibacter sp. SbA3]